ncbi:hypothetical protein H8D30_00260 [bacterium]|nr:hypothetical protein [bacterium]
MKKLILLFLIGVPMALSALPAFSAGNYGGTGYFLTPTAEIARDGEVHLGFLLQQDPEENVQLFGALTASEGDDLYAGGLAFGMGGNLELGWSLWEMGGDDLHHFGLKWNVAGDDTPLVIGGAISITSAQGNQETGFVPYAVFQMPFSHGDFNLGVSYVDDETGSQDVAGFGNLTVWFSDRFRFWAEGTTSSVVTGDIGIGGGFAYQLSPIDPIWLGLGAISLTEFGVQPGGNRTDETMLTLYLQIGMNSHFSYEEDDEEIELFETLGRPS